MTGYMQELMWAFIYQQFTLLMAAFQQWFAQCMVNEMEIQYQMNKIRAATYGRDMWQSTLAIPVAIFGQYFSCLHRPACRIH